MSSPLTIINQTKPNRLTSSNRVREIHTPSSSLPRRQQGQEAHRVGARIRRKDRVKRRCSWRSWELESRHHLAPSRLIVPRRGGSQVPRVGRPDVSLAGARGDRLRECGDVDREHAACGAVGDAGEGEGGDLGVCSSCSGQGELLSGAWGVRVGAVEDVDGCWGDGGAGAGDEVGGGGRGGCHGGEESEGSDRAEEFHFENGLVFVIAIER